MEDLKAGVRAAQAADGGAGGDGSKRVFTINICGGCNVVFGSVQELEKHNEKHHKKTEISRISFGQEGLKLHGMNKGEGGSGSPQKVVVRTRVPAGQGGTSGKTMLTGQVSVEEGEAPQVRRTDTRGLLDQQGVTEIGTGINDTVVFCALDSSVANCADLCKRPQHLAWAKWKSCPILTTKLFWKIIEKKTKAFVKNIYQKVNRDCRVTEWSMYMYFDTSLLWILFPSKYFGM